MALWFWFGLLASVFWGITYVLFQYLLRYLNSFSIVLISSTIVSIILFIYLLATHQWRTMIHDFFGSGKAIFAMLVYIVCYFAATILIMKSINQSNASIAAIIESSYPIFTMVFAYFILHEKQFNWGTIAGTAFIITGLAVIQYTAKV